MVLLLGYHCMLWICVCCLLVFKYILYVRVLVVVEFLEDTKIPSYLNCSWVIAFYVFFLRSLSPPAICDFFFLIVSSQTFFIRNFTNSCCFVYSLYDSVWYWVFSVYFWTSLIFDNIWLISSGSEHRSSNSSGIAWWGTSYWWALDYCHYNWNTFPKYHSR